MKNTKNMKNRHKHEKNNKYHLFLGTLPKAIA